MRTCVLVRENVVDNRRQAYAHHDLFFICVFEWFRPLDGVLALSRNHCTSTKSSNVSSHYCYMVI